MWEFYDAKGERLANGNGLPYRPGDELSATRFVAQPTVNATSPAMQSLLADDSRFIRDAFWSDGTVRVSGREYNGLLESPCFKDATDPGRTLSCFSCHSMHKTADDTRATSEWADDQLGAGKGGNEACLQCHEPLRANPTAHTHHADELGRQLLLQLPHALHHLRAAEDDPQSHGRKPLGQGERRDRTSERVQPLSSGSHARMDGRGA